MAVALACVAACGCGDEGRTHSFESAWARHTIDNSGRGADGVRVADVNGDGLPDVTTGWEQEGETRAYLHPGYGAVKEPWPHVSVGKTTNVEDAVWADIDGDGNMDVVSSCEGATRTVFVNFAPSDPADFLDSSKWTTKAVPATLGTRWMYAVPMSIDGENGIDIVVGGKLADAMVGWLESPSDPRDMDSWVLHEISRAGWIMSMDAIDMNADGRLDLLVSDRAASPINGVTWFENPGDQSDIHEPWPNHVIGAQHRSPTFVAPVFDASGHPSAVIVPSGSERLTLFERENQTENIWSEISLRYPHRLGTPKSASVGDIDLDGVPDVVVSTTNLSGWKEGIVWLSAAAEPADIEPVKHSISGAQGQKFDRTELLDLDGDGDLDVLTTEEIEELGVIWYENPTISPASEE